MQEGGRAGCEEGALCDQDSAGRELWRAGLCGPGIYGDMCRAVDTRALGRVGLARAGLASHRVWLHARLAPNEVFWAHGSVGKGGNED